MTFIQRHPGIRRRGFSVTEATVALFLLAAAATLLAQLTISVQRLGQQTWRTQLLHEELANLAEHTAALPWGELTAERIEQLPLGEFVQQEFPMAKLQVEVTALAEKIPTRQVTLSINLGPHEPAPRLTVWRFSSEAQP